MDGDVTGKLYFLIDVEHKVIGRIRLLFRVINISQRKIKMPHWPE